MKSLRSRARCILALLVLVGGMWAQGLPAQASTATNPYGYRYGGGQYQSQATVTQGPGIFDANYILNGTFDFLGCSFTLSEFIGINFNIPTSFEEIRYALQTRLVKWFLVNMTILPQLQAAIQDFMAKLGVDLNFTYEACNLSTLAADQRKQQMAECNRLYGGGSSTESYNQCIQGKGSAAADAITAARNTLNEFTKSACNNFTETVRGLFCGRSDGSGSGAISTGGTCPVMAFLPQMRLGCTTQTGSSYVTMGGDTQQPLFSIGQATSVSARYAQAIMSGAYTPVQSLWSSGLTKEQIALIAEQAKVKLQEKVAQGQVPVADSGNNTDAGNKNRLALTTFDTQQFGETSYSSPDVLKFQAWLNCNSAQRNELLMGQTWYEAATALGFGSYATQPTIPADARVNVSSLMSSAGGTSMTQDMKAALAMLEVAVICNMNKLNSVPLTLAMGRAEENMRSAAGAGISARVICRSMNDVFTWVKQKTDGAEAIAQASDRLPANPGESQAKRYDGSTAGKESRVAFIKMAQQTYQNILNVNAEQCQEDQELNKAMDSLMQDMLRDL